MAASGGRQQRKFTPSPVDTLNLRPCLVHVPTGDIVKSYSQLSRIVKKLGWKVFIDVSGNVWSAWYLPAGEACFIQMVYLPHPHISTATYYQLTTVVHALGVNTFNISYAPLKKFKELEVYSDFHKPTLRLKSNGREVVTVRAFAQILYQHGWRKEGENQFIKSEASEKGPVNLLSVIRIPAVENLHQLSTLDLEYIALVTDNIFYLQNPVRFQPPRKLEGKPPKVPTPNASTYTKETTTNTQSTNKTEEHSSQKNVTPSAAAKPTERTSTETGETNPQKTPQSIASQTAAEKTVGPQTASKDNTPETYADPIVSYTDAVKANLQKPTKKTATHETVEKATVADPAVRSG